MDRVGAGDVLTHICAVYMCVCVRMGVCVHRLHMRTHASISAEEVCVIVLYIVMHTHTHTHIGIIRD